MLSKPSDSTENLEKSETLDLNDGSSSSNYGQERNSTLPVSEDVDPDAFESEISKYVASFQDSTNSAINAFLREVSGNEQLKKQLSAFKNGTVDKNDGGKLADFAKLYYKILRYQNMVNRPSRFCNKTGYPYGKVNLLSADPTNESVSAKSKTPDFIVGAMRTRIEEESKELEKLIAVNRIAPPYPHIEKRGKIVNELPHGMGNPNADATKKTKKDLTGDVDVGGRPSEVDKDVHTTSWDREDKVNTHMSKSDKAELKFRKGIDK